MYHQDAHNVLKTALETIARQKEEIAHLHSQLGEEQFARTLRRALITATTASQLASPVQYTQLLEMIVKTASTVIASRAASLFLIDRKTNELVFEVALGQKAEEAKKFRVALGHGFVGLVASSGQPMAVSNAGKDPRQASDVAQAVGYVPQTLLCVPLLYSGQVIGVLELLDKEGDLPFTANDIHVLGMFAEQAAISIALSRVHDSLVPLLVTVMEQSNAIPDQQPEYVQEQIEAFLTSVEESAAYHNAMSFARLVHDISRQGEDELVLCHAVLSAFSNYLQTRMKSTMELGWL